MPHHVSQDAWGERPPGAGEEARAHRAVRRDVEMGAVGATLEEGDRTTGPVTIVEPTITSLGTAR